MAKGLLLLFGVMVFQRCSKAAPSDPIENIHPVITASIERDITLDSEPNNARHPTNDNDASESQRQKRFYDFTGFEYLPYDYPTALSYPSQPQNVKRDNSHNTAVYGTEDPLNLIFKRLHEIVRDVRYQNVPQPSYTPIPAYIPFFYIPQFDCGCTNNNQGPAPPVSKPTPQPPLPPTSSDKPANGIETTTNSSVTLDNRGGFDDKRQNWGVVTSKPNLNDVVSTGDGSRPINFDPIPPEEPMDIPVPPVDHGTVQAGAEPAQNPNQINSPPRAQNPSVTGYVPERPEVMLESPASISKNYVPSLCDGAIISCCNRPQITNKCFEALGCEDPSIYGSPCDPKVQLMVINKFQYFQKRRAG